MNRTGSLGDPGERLVSSLLEQAMLAQVHPATSFEDDRAIDHRIVYDCPFSGQIRTIACQVKTGDSFGKWTETKRRFRIDVEENFRQKLASREDPSLLIWIPVAGKAVFYAFVPPRRKLREPLYVRPDDEISPAMLFDVGRKHLLLSRPEKVRRVTFVHSGTISEALTKKRHRADLCFDRAAIVRNLRLPCSALRHVTRASRPSDRRRLSMDVLKYLPVVLQRRPESSQCLRQKRIRVGKRQHVESLLLFRYANAFQSSLSEYSLLLRVRETISFPAEWKHALLCLEGPHEGGVQSQALVETWYLKREKG